MRTVVCSVLVLAMLAGCAHRPNTPGAGSGDSYTPVIDLQGVDQGRYANDLVSCRSYSQQIDAGGQAMAGALAGILIGAAVGAAAGGNRRFMQQTAVAGGTGGILGAGGRAISKQEQVIANCMAGRGYRVLEGATVPVNYSAPSPYLPPGVVAIPAVAAPVPVAVAVPAAAPVPVAVSPSAPVAVAPVAAVEVVPVPVVQSAPVLAAVPVPVQVASPAGAVGPDSYTVEKRAQAESCAAQPRAFLVGKGPGFANYSVACANGDSWIYRCEFGNCRALR